MTPRTLQTVLRSLAEAAPPAGDAELLRRFVAGDGEAFGELVRRYGRLVWAVCRHLTGSDAEADDSFQATFLVLLRSARKIRDPGRLSAWLHGVAYKVCARARRVARERAAAVSERAGSAVADSAWDRALAAVHEEAGRLPESLRVPFVLCCLEGRGVTEAAEQLGWKLGTLSGRLTRAKDAVLERIKARGLTLGAVAGLGLAAPPPAAVAAAAELARGGSVIPDSVLQLARGVIGMSVTTFRVLAAAVLTCGLGLGAGTGWTATADAQAPGKLPAQKSDPEAEVKRLQAELEKARQELEAAARKTREAERAAARDAELALQALAAVEKGKDAAPAKTSRWEYDFVVVSDMTQAKFVEFLQDRENRGWEYNGTTPLTHQGKPTPTWVFRRPTKAAQHPAQYGKLLDEYYDMFNSYHRKLPPDALSPHGGAGQAGEAKAIEAEIAKLQERLAALKSRPKANWSRATFTKNELPLDPTELMTLLGKLAERKFEKDRYSLSAQSHGLVVEGDNEVIDWVTALIKKLNEK